MISDGRFSRLSPPAGEHLAAGALRITIDGFFVGYGTFPVWLNDYVLLYTRQPDPANPGQYPDNGMLMAYNRISRETVEVKMTDFTPDSLCANLLGQWAVCRGRTIITSDGRQVQNVFRSTYAGADLCWCVDTGTTADLYREGKLIERTVHDVRGEPDGRLCYVKVRGAEQWACVHYPDGHIAEWRLKGAEEYHPHIINWLGEEWMLSHTRDDRLLLRTGNNGIVIARGDTYEPDAVVMANGFLRVVWADTFGRLVDREIVPLTRTTFGVRGEGLSGSDTLTVGDLRPVVEPISAPWPPGVGWKARPDITEIDIVEYLLGDRSWSRNGMHVPADAVTYTHPFQSRVVGSAVQHSKFGPPRTRAATWPFTDKWVGLGYDGTNALGESGGHTGYRFVNPGTSQTAALYPRIMKVGKQHAHIVTLDILDLNTGKPRTVKWKGWVASVYENLVPIGDIPAGTTHAVVMFEPQPDDPATWRETNIGARHLGCWYWDAEKVGTGKIDQRWVGTKNAPRFEDIEALFADAPPVEIIEVPKPPTPPEEPEVPSPTLPSVVALQYGPSGLFAAVEPDGSIIVNRGEAGGYETLQVKPGADVFPGSISLLAHTGKYLRATDAGENLGLKIAATAEGVATYESFLPVKYGDGYALMTFHGGVLQPNAQGALVGVLSPLDQHLWTLKPMTGGGSGGSGGGGGSTSERLLSGSLRIADDGKCFVDNNGPYNPVIKHAGDLLSRVIRGLRGDPSHLAFVEESLRIVRANLYDGIRTWIATYGPREGTFWWLRDTNPNDPLFDQAVLWLCDALKRHGLGWLVSAGDISMLYSSMAERTAIMRRVALLIASKDPSLVLGVDGGNEAWQTGEPDPARLRQIAQAFRDVIPCAVWSCTSGASESTEDVNKYVGSVADKHGFRDNDTWDRLRHIFSPTVEGGYARWLIIDSEMFGYGRNVSATNRMETVTADNVRMACVQAWLSRTLPVIMSSVGVISDGKVERLDKNVFRPIFDAGESFADARGIDAPIVARKIVPSNIMAWPERVHGGARMAGRRVRAVPSDDPTRSDQALSGTGQVFALEYGPRWSECYSEKSLTIEVEHHWSEGRAIYGRR